MCDEDAEDRKLVTQFLHSRDEQAFRAMYRRHTPKLYLFTIRLCCGDSHQAEDVVQEAWIRAVEKLSGFQWKSKFSTWLTGIALNCYRETQSNSPEVPSVLPEIAIAEDQGATLDLESLIHRLPYGCREIFLLHDLEGYTHAEIGTALNISSGTSKSQLFEARKKLRNWLDGRKENDK